MLLVVYGLCAAALIVPRNKVFIPLLLSTCYLGMEDGIYIADLSFPAYRLVLLVALMRVLLRGECACNDQSGITRALFLWALYSLFSYTFLYGEFSAFVLKAGKVSDVIGLFIVFRSTVRNLEDVHGILEFYPLLIPPLALAMLYENRTGLNPFSIFGNTPEFSQIRGDHVRAQGVFRHAILAGTFGATCIPLILTRLWTPQFSKWKVVVGLLAATTITFSSTSSGALIVYGVCVAGLVMWTCRQKMFLVRWGAVAVLGTLIIIMKAPVWYVFARLSNIVGGTGWHRSKLLDNAFGEYFHEWWLIGTTYTRHWMPYGVPHSPDHCDITNQYLNEGINGGILTMLLFIWVCVASYRAVGHALTTTDDDFYTKFTVWALGASLIGHLVAFMSVPYFDQIIVHWYLLLAMIIAAGKHNMTGVDLPPE